VSLLSIFDVLELDVSETLGSAGFSVGWETNSLDAVVSEERPHGVFVRVEGEISNEERSTGWALRISECLSTLLAVFLRISWETAVDLDGTTVDLLAVHLESLVDSFSGCEVDVAETARPSGVAVGLDGSRFDLSALSEFLSEAVVVD
jgi:hypothetical protein